MKHIATIILLAGGLPSAALAQAEAAFGPAIAEFDIPGLVVGVTHNGQHSFFATGMADRDKGIAATPDTVFELGSISKIFTVTLAALAQSRGQLSFDAPIADQLPALQGSQAGALTLADLATHHSGGLPLQVPETVADVDGLIDWLGDWQAPEPGARSYSNVSIGLLGHITAKAMGMPYAEAAQMVLFPAMGLTSTWMDVPDAAMDRYAFGYDRKTDAPIRVTPGVLDAEAYGVKSTARDMLTMLDAALGRAAAPEIAAAMARTQAPLFQTRLFSQAMIWESYPWPVDTARMVEGNGLDFILNPQPMEAAPPATGPMILNKTGSTDGFGGYVALLPQEDLGIVMLANRNIPNEARVRATLALIEALLR